MGKEKDTHLQPLWPATTDNRAPAAQVPGTHFAGSLMQLHQLQDEEAIAWMSRWSKAYEK